jgi:muconolactone delta-isomerase
MLMMVITTPRADPPSTMTRRRQKLWRWIAPKLKARRVHWIYARPGRGAVALFDVESHEQLHVLLNEWAEIIPATFELLPLIDAAAAQRYLAKKRARR